MRTSVKALILSLGISLSLPSIADSTFSSCVENLKSQALEAAIKPDVVNNVLASVKYLPDVIKFDRKQPEFSTTFYNYFRKRVTESKIEKGRKLLKENSKLLKELTKQYGVPGHYLVAFWGMETNFGSYLGKMDTLNSLATLACDQRRSEFFTSQLFEALRLIESGVIQKDLMQGSWAGAMGNMQFMPSTYRRYGLDADLDGKVDMWNSRVDAFTSAAFYLQQLGWDQGWRWGREVLLPKGFDYSLSGLDKGRSLKEWAKLGVTDVWENPVSKLEKTAALVVPAGHRGPAFLVYDNFKVIMKWNMSQFYALSVGILADRINGLDGLRVSPPKADNFTIAEIKSLQSNLNSLGYDAGEVDGIFGSNTKLALKAFQSDYGIIADGFPHSTVIKKLEETASAKDTAR